MMNQVTEAAAAAENAGSSGDGVHLGTSGAQPVQIGPHGNPVHLASGAVVSSSSEEWRAECEAFERLRQFSEGAKLDGLLEGAAKKRGASAIPPLRQRIAFLEPFFVLDRLPDKSQRKSYLDKVEAARGRSARQALEERVVTLWRSRQ